MYSVGVDIGGMSVKIGIVDNGNIIAKKVIKPKTNPQTEFIKIIANTINDLIVEAKINKSEIAGVGVGCPGSVDYNDGIVLHSGNLNLKNLNIKQIIEEITKLPCMVGNDADLAALGEVKFGIAKGYSDVIMLTIGTGIGGGIIVNGKLYTGYRGMAGELGHISLFYNGIKCGCGRSGCFEQYASATALIKQTKQAMLLDKNSSMWNLVGGDIDKVDGITAFSEAKKCDKTAENVVSTFVSYLTEGIMNYCNIFRPQAVIVGGAISNEGSFLLDKIYNYLEKFEYGYPGTSKVEILTANLKNDAGIIGASSLIFG
jgi:glucokinase